MSEPIHALAYAGREAPIVVLKFGSSVLSSRECLPSAVSEIYRFVRAGRRVVAVTSAFAGVTDELIAEAASAGCPHDNLNAPALVAIGEETSAVLLALACDRAGMNAIALKAPELGILAEGPVDDASPLAIDASHLNLALSTHDVVVAPGFVATGPDRRTVLLGRGGSDLTAVFLGHALKAERVRLLKDVDGVYERDPAAVPGAGRFRHIGWEHACEVAAPLIQPRALAFAAKHALDIEVGSLGADDVTLVGRHDAPSRPPAKRRKLKVALAGLGVVGAGVAQRLLQRPEAFEIVSVLVREPKKRRDVKLNPKLFVRNADDLLHANPDVVVDALSCGATGAQLSEAALRQGIDVVSANKQAIASAYTALKHIARRTGARLFYSAAVGGGAPLLEAVSAAAANESDILAIEGVWNGTINFLLERLAQGESFETALKAAQKAGLAEEDPSADLSGADAAAKLKLVSLTAFGASPGEVSFTVTPLNDEIIARASQARLKQVARITHKGGELAGEINFEPAYGGSFVQLDGDRNAIAIRGASGRVWSARGRGAGRGPTTESVFADLVDLSALSHARDIDAGPEETRRQA